MNLTMDFGKTPLRLKLESFLRQHASDKFTLEIGAGHLPHTDSFPNQVTMDIVSYPHNDVQGDAHRLPFRDEVFEVILCTEVLEHLHTPNVALREMRRVLKPGGELLLTTPFAYPLHDAPVDYYRYTSFGLTHLLREWNVEHMSESTTDAVTLAIFFHYWLLKNKGLLWKLPKLVWRGVWFLLQQSCQSTMRSEMRSLMPSGHLVIARRPQ